MDDLTTDLGVIHTDLLLRPDTSDYIDFEGKLTAQDLISAHFWMHQIFWEKISLSTTINGSTLAGKTIDAALNIMVQNLSS